MTRFLLPTPLMGRTSLSGAKGKPRVSVSVSFEWGIDWIANANAPGYVAEWDSRVGITKDGSNRVSEWLEAHGNGMSGTQSTDGNKPVWTDNYWGNVPALNFTAASSQGLPLNTAGLSVIRNGAEFTCYGIFRGKTNGNSNIIGGNVNSNANGRFHFGHNSSALSGTPTGIGGGSRVGDTGSPRNVNGPKTLKQTHSFANWTIDGTNGKAYIHLNNALSVYDAGYLSGSIPNTAMGSGSIGLAVGTPADMYCERILVCKGVHSDAQRREVWKGILSTYGADAGYAPILLHAPTKQIILHGDSNVQGNGMTTLGAKNLENCLFELYEASGVHAAIVNHGISGAQGNSMNTIIPGTSNTLPEFPDDENYVVILCGVNDIAASTSSSDTYNRMVTAATTIKTAHPNRKVIVCTYPAWTSGSTNKTNLYNFNQLLLANTDTHIDAICDLGSIPQCLNDGSANAAAANTTYYESDGLHFKQALQEILAVKIKETIDSLS